MQSQLPSESFACRSTHAESNVEFGAQIADTDFGLVHGSHGQEQLGGGHLLGPATIAGAGRGRARFGPLDDYFPLEFDQGGKDAEHQLTARKCGADAGAVPGQHLEANATRCDVMHRVDQVPQIAAARSDCSIFWLKARRLRERGCAIYWRSKTSD